MMRATESDNFTESPNPGNPFLLRAMDDMGRLMGPPLVVVERRLVDANS